MAEERDFDLDTLLDLNGHVLAQESGYWIKIEAWKVEPTEDIPHGIRYSLTLHDASGVRILGYDNAHRVERPKKFKYAGQRLPFDHAHQHASDKGKPYEFDSPSRLLADFFDSADRIMKELTK